LFFGLVKHVALFLFVATLGIARPAGGQGAQGLLQVRDDRMKNKTPIEERFWSKVDKSGGPAACWPWTAARSRGNYGDYGAFAVDRRTRRAHRVAYELTHGAIADVPGYMFGVSLSCMFRSLERAY
jgi:hypothetical protein